MQPLVAALRCFLRCAALPPERLLRKEMRGNPLLANDSDVACPPAAAGMHSVAPMLFDL